ncbi:hypothetical protein DICVIV_03298 [Dictyocaulus viviparus]|uniref:Uncharacterized protein n=1 Tax=Dictyocaulus viviparus TaxID=29172 RepID=A0A0D8Y0Y6_DICVI|nr:hypothetical protein DICVIV_03298 [Dictyocaulus viviparus]
MRLNSLHRYTMFVGTVSCLQHAITDGLWSLPILTDVFYLICTHYGCSSRNSYTRTVVRKSWQISRIKTFFRIFSVTVLSLLRVIFLSLHESEVDDTIAVPTFLGLLKFEYLQYLAYVQLLIAFTDNLSLCCELEENRSYRERNFYWNGRRRSTAAAAA